MDIEKVKSNESAAMVGLLVSNNTVGMSQNKDASSGRRCWSLSSHIVIIQTCFEEVVAVLSKYNGNTMLAEFQIHNNAENFLCR